MNLRRWLEDRLESLSLGRVLTVVLLVVAVTLVIVLGRRYQELDTAFRDFRDRTVHAHPGTYVPTYSTTSLGEDTVDVGQPEPGTGQLLYFYTTTCPHCRATIPAWQEIADSIRRAGLPLEPVAVSLDSLDATRAYASKHQLTMPTVVMNSMRYIRLFRVGAVPLVIVVNDRSQVIYARRGRIETQPAMDSVLTGARSIMSEQPETTAIR